MGNNNVPIEAVWKAFTTVASYATAHAGFPVVLEKCGVEQGIVVSRFGVDGRDLEFNMTPTADAASVARVLATHADWKANDIKTSLDVPDLWCTWWQNCTANDDVCQTWWNDIATGREEEFEAEAIQVKLEEIQEHVLAAVEADAEFVSALFKLADVLRGYRERTVCELPDADTFSAKVFNWLLCHDGVADWGCGVSPDEIMRFTDLRSGRFWSVAIDGEPGEAGESMWVNMCDGAMSPDFEPLEFGSVDAAVAGVGRWLLAAAK